MSSLFKGYQFVLEVDFSFQYKQKQELKKKITNNGGEISYVLTKETNFLIVSNINQADTTYKGRTAQKNGTPIVTISFISKCVKEGRVVDPTAYLASGSKLLAGFEKGKIKVKNTHKKSATAKKPTFNFDAVQVWTWGDNKAPEFDEDSYEVAKSCLLLQKSSKSNEGDQFYQMELHVLPLANQTSENEENKCCFRVFSQFGTCNEMKNESSGSRLCRYLTSSSDALKTYAHLYDTLCPNKGYKKCNKFISRWIGSDKQRKISLESSCESGAKSTAVVDLVEHIWQEANKQIKGMLTSPEETLKKEQVEKAEATLLQIRQELDSRQRKTELNRLSKLLYEILPLQKGRTSTIEDRQMLSKMHDICQLLKDMVSVSEATDFSARSSIESKFRALRCHIEHLRSSAPEYKQILHLVKSNNESRNNFDIQNIFAVNRSIEETNFMHRLGNKKLLFHASKPANFVGIFTRGLLLPKIVVEDFGGNRRDPGNLGSGIYFTDSSSTCAKYSSRSTVKGSRFMLVNEVALGKCLDMTTKNYKLSSAPEGYNSVHAVKRAVGKKSVFEDNEYVVYNTSQQRIRYLIEFALPEDKIINFIQKSLKETLDEEDDSQMMDISIDDIQSLQDPLDKVQAGLQSKDNHSVPLTAVHVRAKLIDLAAQVVVLQAYKNKSIRPIEAKYVFPLDDMAAVCGFEAFIDGKHIVGEVKDKEVAHQEYREAISKGHGAYLMDEEAPDVFTVSVGNLTPNSEVLIKITYVAELAVDCGKIVFNIPGSVAPWKKDEALSVKTQKELLTKLISGNVNTSIQIAVEMPYDIRAINSPTHDIKIKHATTKASVELVKEVALNDGFQLLIELAEVHVPRMWVEKHPEKVDSQACMLTFYPEFESKSSKSPEILLVLDLSNSMKGETLLEAKKILLMNLECLPPQATFNIITFGTNFDELFPASRRKTASSIYTAKTFIRNVKANMGNTEVWRPLHAYFLLSVTTCFRNIFLISDGHINNEESTLNAIQLNAKNNRVFTFGISKTANKHLLRAIARVGTGAFEFFDTTRKSKWARKVKCQLLKARQPALSNVSVEWQQFDDNASKPIQAPGQITSLFSGSRQVVYGYVPFCRQATLRAEINGDEISTMVSTNEINVTRGKTLHQLTARAIIRDWEDGTLDVDPVEHEVKKDAQKSYIIDLSKEYSIVTQFTSFIAVEEREKTDFVEAVFKPSITDLVANEDVDDLPYVCWDNDINPNIETPPMHGRHDYGGLGYNPRDPEDISKWFDKYCSVDSQKQMSRRRLVMETANKGRGRHLLEYYTPEISSSKKKKSISFFSNSRKSRARKSDRRFIPLKSMASSAQKSAPRRLHFTRTLGMTTMEHGFEDEESDSDEPKHAILQSARAPEISSSKKKKSISFFTNSRKSRAGKSDRGLIPLKTMGLPTREYGLKDEESDMISNATTSLMHAGLDMAVEHGFEDEESDSDEPKHNAILQSTREPNWTTPQIQKRSPAPPDSPTHVIQHKLTSSNDSDHYLDELKSKAIHISEDMEQQMYMLDSVEPLQPIQASTILGRSKAFKKTKNKTKRGFGFSFPNVSKANRRNVSNYTLESCANDFRSEKKRLHFDMLSLYRKNGEVCLLSEECSAVCTALKRAINKQNPGGSWSMYSIQELTEFGNHKKCGVSLCTATVVCLLELVLLNWKMVSKALNKFAVNSVYQNAFDCLMEAESFLRRKSSSKIPNLESEEQDNWLEYVEIQILDASVPTDLGVNSSLFVVPEKLISFEQRMKVLKKSEIWLRKRFWTLSPSFAVLFGIKRKEIIGLLKQSGIKELDLKIQEEVHAMLALAIGICWMSAHIDNGVTSTMVKTLQSWLYEKEIANPGLASQLKLGGDWLDVASKMSKKTE